MKRVNTRIQNMISSCLNHSDNKENNNQDFCDDSRSSSPIQFSSDLLGKKRKCSVDVVANDSHEKTACKGSDGAILNPNLSAKLFTVFAEASPCPLSPQLSLATNLVKENIARPTSGVLICHDDIETAVEKSIEPPPYSPLTPRPAIAKNNETSGDSLADTISNNTSLNSISLRNDGDQPIETLTEKSIESVNIISPLPLMSPETATLFNNILADSMDNNDSNNEALSDTSTIASLRGDNVQLFNNSDDSVRDPDYCANTNYASSDDSSNDSITLITGTAHAEINQIPNLINEFPGHQPDPKHLGPHNTSQEVAVVDDEMVSVSETDRISDNVNTNNGTLSVRSMSYHETESSLIERHPMGRQKKGRKPKFGGLSREERKKRKYQNLSYVNSRKKIVNPKNFVDFRCSCLKKCHEKIPVERRLAQFQKFYSLGSYNAQNMFLTSLVKEQPVKRHYIATDNETKVSKKKSYSRYYFLDGVLVCRDMFVKTLQTSAKRINTSLNKMRSDSCITDNRGLHGGHNRASFESEDFVINFIKRLPTYVSHYRREKTEGAKYLRADMTLSKIYELYSDEAKTAGVAVLSAAKVNKLFFTNFNLHTKSLKKDTCNKCDFFQSQIIHASSEQTRVDIESKRAAHQELANSLQNQLRLDMKLAKDDRSVETLTFDLEKTLPLPRIPTNIVFYKRQLWVYNLGIHTGSNDEAHCNVWVEGEAGRGAQEVGSCLIKHILERLDGNVKCLILWCDSCGGQNRNIKLTLMLKAMLNIHPTLNQINIRFLESGHSFLPNDSDFAKIECALKRQQRLYTPDDYIQVMKTCKKTNPMHVHRMKNEDFLSSLKLEKNIINRKKTINGEKVSWLKTKEIMVKKTEMFNIYMKSNLDEDFVVVNIKKNVRGRQYILTKDLMEPLWPTGKPVPEAKLSDLKSMLHLIPQDSHNFYTKLVGNANLEDDLEGFSGQPDFEVESLNLD